MSPELEKVFDLDHLPIFPLPVVLMPHEILPLHIFEPKYREMFADLSLTKNMFGLMFFEPTREFDEKPPLGSLGCVAELMETESLPDGKSNILSIGIIRFRIVDYLETSAPYFSANVEYFEDDSAGSDLNAIADEVSMLFERLAKAATRLSGNRAQIPEISSAGPEQLSFLVASSLSLPTDEKYKLIETPSTADRLMTIRSKLTESVKSVEESARIEQISRTNGHANKKIDLGP